MRAAGRQVDQLDGVRALAVLAVMAFHDFRSAAGYFGVDVFFVLSGMLITGILLGERETRGSIDLRRFYARRMLRLYPALLVMLVLTSPFGAQLSGDGTWGSWWTSVAVSGTYTANVAILVHGTQFLGALGPMWSLAVEMQYYLLWPPVLAWLLSRAVDRRALAAGVLAVAAACLALFWVLGTAPDPRLAVAPSYFRSDARFGELLIGCGLALLLSLRTRPPSRRGEWALGAAGLAGVAGLLLARDVLLHRGTVAPLPIVAVATALVLARLVTSDRALLSRLLRLPPLPQVGRISYAMYLWQLPLLTLSERWHDGPHGQDLWFWGGTLVAGAVSTHVVERPFQRWRRRLRRTRAVAGVREPVGASPEPAPALSGSRPAGGG